MKESGYRGQKSKGEVGGGRREQREWCVQEERSQRKEDGRGEAKKGKEKTRGESRDAKR